MVLKKITRALVRVGERGPRVLKKSALYIAHATKKLKKKKKKQSVYSIILNVCAPAVVVIKKITSG